MERPDGDPVEHTVGLADCAVTLVADRACAGLLDRLAALFDTSVDLPPRRAAEVRLRRSADGGVVVDAATGPVAARDDEDAVDQVLAAVNALVLPPSTLLTLHAGVVLSAAGALAWPAFSGAGKSTLVAAAVGRGLPLVSDEALCLDPADAAVVPYPKPVSLDAAMAARLGLVARGAEPAYAAGGLGGRATGASTHLGAVVLLERRPGDPALEPVGSDRAAAALLRHSFNHFRMPLAAVTVVHAALAGADVVSLGYDDPVAGAALLADTFGTPAG